MNTIDKESFTFIISKDEEGIRIDVLLSELLDEMSRSNIQKLIEKGHVFVNGKSMTTKNHKLKNGDRISLTIEKPKLFKVLPEDIPLDIIWEDNDIIVINKPKGMVVHPASGNFSGTLVNALIHHCGGNLSTINGDLRPGIIHRLDKDTGGLLIVGKNNPAHISLAEQLARHEVLRSYNALVHNNFKEDEGTINAPIDRDPGNRLRMAVVEGGRESVTHYWVLERFGDYTYLGVNLETGRTHQIRVHMAYIKHPLVGDALYGPKKQALGATSQMLHSVKLGFIHPTTRVYMEFESPVAEEFESILKKLRNGKGR